MNDRPTGGRTELETTNKYIFVGIKVTRNDKAQNNVQLIIFSRNKIKVNLERK